MKHDLSFTDWIKRIETRYFEEEWLVLYERYKADDGQEKRSIYSGLVKRNKVCEILKSTDWDRLPTHGIYGITTRWNKNSRAVKYYTYHDDSVEPLVYIRDFEGIHPNILSILEEIVVNFQLLVKEQRNIKTFYFTDDNGKEEDAIYIDKELVRIKRRFLLEYMYLKRMDFVLYFELWRYSDQGLEELGLTLLERHVKDECCCYDIYIDESNEFTTQSKSQGWIIGKRVYRLPRNYKSWYFNSEETPKEYEKFIIGEGKSGEDICHTCDDNYLSDFFGKNPGSPHYFTLVFFDLGVMQKYYNNPNKYRVKDGGIDMIGRWSLRIDNNRSDVVISYLGDLGRLPYAEQKYWRSFNIRPITHSVGAGSDTEYWKVDGRPRFDQLSEVAFRRGVLAEFTAPEAPDLVFKDALPKFYEQFYKQNGWHIIKPLNDGDRYRLKTIHMSVGDSEIEFKNQIESLCIILIESIDVSILERILGNRNENEKSISLLKRALEMRQIDDEGTIEFLTNLNTLRNMMLHRSSTGKLKTEKKKAMDYFSIDTSTYSDVLRLILSMAQRLLSVLMKMSNTVAPESHTQSQ